MGNIFKVLRRDFLRLFKVPAAWVILFGMVFIPPLYSWYNIVGFWDPYGNTKGITVAIANNDDGTDNALIGKQNLGDQIVKQMRSNDQLGWTFVTEAEAMDQVESGKAYAAIIIPKDFSDDLAGVVTGGKSRPTLEYYVNEKASAIAPKVTDVGASTVDRTVNSTFVSTVSEVLTEVINTVDGKAISTEDTTKAKALTALAKASDDVQHTRSTIAKLTTKLTDTPEQTRTARQALDDARTLGIDTAEGLAGVSTLIGTTQTSLNGFVTSTSEALDQGSSLLSQAAAQANQSVGTVTGTISAAARQLYIAQPSLTSAVKELENELGITIFKRTNKGVLLSPEGQEFFGLCPAGHGTDKLDRGTLSGNGTGQASILCIHTALLLCGGSLCRTVEAIRRRRIRFSYP